MGSKYFGDPENDRMSRAQTRDREIYHSLSMKKAPESSFSVSCLPERREVKNVSPANSSVLEEVTKISWLK